MNYVDMPSKLISRNGDNAAPVTQEKAINNSIHNIITTPKGSVPGNPEFGSGMHKYIFEPMDPLVKESIKAEIEYAIKRWEQRVIIKLIDIVDDPDYNRVTIKMIYNVKTDVKSTQHEYIFSQQSSNNN